MPTKRLRLSLLACALALSACAANSPRVVPVECPKLPPLPAMTEPSYEQQLRELWLSDPVAMLTCDGCRVS